MNDMWNPDTDLSAAYAGIAKALDELMAPWREFYGIPELRDVGYVGNRCGWYPAKPRRRRAVTVS